MSKLAVVTITCGNLYNKIAKITHPTIKAYADKIGADFIVWTDYTNHTHPDYKKVELSKLFDTYDRIAYIDTDIIVRPDTPSIFAAVPEDEMGLFNEGQFTERRGAMYQYMSQVNFDPSQWDGKYYNAGVIVASRCHAAVFAQPPVEINNFYAQTYLNVMICWTKMRVHNLHYKFNRMSCMDSITGEHRRDSYLLHYAGMASLIDPNKFTEEQFLKTVQNDLDQWKIEEPLYKYQKSIALMVGGGLGDQVAAEPVARYMVENMYKGENIVISTTWPEIFKHLNVPVYRPEDTVQNVSQYRRLYSLQSPEHDIWEHMAHTLTHAVDWSSICALRCQLPITSRQPKLEYSADDLLGVETKTGLKVQEMNKHLVVLHPGRGWPSKTFPVDVWQSWMDIIRGDGYIVAVIGKRISSEQGIVEVETEGCLDLIDKLSISEMFALLAHARVLISNDSAPIHIAGAFDNWIGLIATCKHPDFILPYRHGKLYHKAVALEEQPMYDEFNRQPTQIYTSTIDNCDEKRLRECLPKPEKILDFVRKSFLA